MHILRRSTLYYGRYALKITIVAIVLIFIMLIFKYKPMYKVTIKGETIGYIANKKELENIIDNYINTDETNIAFVDIKDMPEYQLNLVNWGREDDTEKILQRVKETSIVTYRLFAIALDNEAKEYVATVAEAEEVVEQIKREFDGMVDLNISVQEIYTQDLESIESIDTKVVIAKLDEEVIENSGDAVIDNVILSKPTTGLISSRYGSRWGKNHTGIDIASQMGTPIYACSKGKVKYTGWSGGYGNLVIIDHGNGIETYYAHCNKIYVSEGSEVTKDTLIAEMGSTGNSTGPHLHLEIRKDGVAQNPQKYLYN